MLLKVIISFYNAFKDEKIDVIVGIESRGFIFAAPLAFEIRLSVCIGPKTGKTAK